jgi:hypothetical protein
MLTETLRGMTTLRLSGSETVRHALWQTRLTDAVNADVRVARIGIWQSTANILIFGIEGILSVWLAIGFVIAGTGFSVGMVFAYMAYKSQFLGKVAGLVDQGIWAIASAHSILGSCWSKRGNLIASLYQKVCQPNLVRLTHDWHVFRSGRSCRFSHCDCGSYGLLDPDSRAKR